MSFAKSFGLSLVIFIGLNVMFFFIGYTLIDGGLDAFFTALETDLSVILEPLFGPLFGPIIAGILYADPAIPTTGMGPESILNVALAASDLELGFIILLIGYVAAPLVAAILAGRFAENKIEALLGWFLAIMVSVVILLSWRGYALSDAGNPADLIIDFAIFTAGLGVIIGIFYGCFALLFTSTEYF
ncbi:MAG: hypothetical protein ACFFAQ_09500 [Promethearchaeota archaeon]